MSLYCPRCGAPLQKTYPDFVTYMCDSMDTGETHNETSECLKRQRALMAGAIGRLLRQLDGKNPFPDHELLTPRDYAIRLLDRIMPKA